MVVCETCGAQFAVPQQLSNHMDREHYAPSSIDQGSEKDSMFRASEPMDITWALLKNDFDSFDLGTIDHGVLDSYLNEGHPDLPQNYFTLTPEQYMRALQERKNRYTLQEENEALSGDLPDFSPTFQDIKKGEPMDIAWQLLKGKKPDPRLKSAGVSGYNKPKRTPSHPKKSHVVVARSGGKTKTIRFGEQGASVAGKPKSGESPKMKAKRKSFKSRHAKNIKRGPMSAAYWADKVKW